MSKAAANIVEQVSRWGGGVCAILLVSLISSQVILLLGQFFKTGFQYFVIFPICRLANPLSFDIGLSLFITFLICYI